MRIEENAQREAMRVGGKYVVIKRDMDTGEEVNLTMPGPRRSTESSCRRFKNIGIENVFVTEYKKQKRKRKGKKK